MPCGVLPSSFCSAWISPFSFLISHFNTGISHFSFLISHFKKTNSRDNSNCTI